MHSLTVLGLALVLRQVSHHTVFVGAAGAADSGKELEALSASGTPLPLHDEFSRHLLREPGPLLDTDSEVKDLEIEGPRGPIPVRVYRPEIAGLLPTLVWIHGGGWCSESVQSYDSYCKRLSHNLRAVIISVDYRLAPQHPFPAGLEDCYAVAAWAHEHAKELKGNPSTLAVAGDSAGGNLAAAVVLMAKERGSPPIRLQLLISPVLDCPGTDWPSYTEEVDRYPSPEFMKMLFGQYAPDSSYDDPLLCPMRAANLSDLPPALIFTAEHDPLRDEAEAYAVRLEAARVDVTVRRFNGAGHGLLSGGLVSYIDFQLEMDLVRASWQYAMGGPEHLYDNLHTHVHEWTRSELTDDTATNIAF